MTSKNASMSRIRQSSSFSRVRRRHVHHLRSMHCVELLLVRNNIRQRELLSSSLMVSESCGRGRVVRVQRRHSRYWRNARSCRRSRNRRNTSRNRSQRRRCRRRSDGDFAVSDRVRVGDSHRFRVLVIRMMLFSMNLFMLLEILRSLE